MELILQTLNSPNFSKEDLAKIIDQLLAQKENAFSSLFINWLSKHQKIESKAKKTTHTQLDLKNLLLSVIKILATDINGRKETFDTLS